MHMRSIVQYLLRLNSEILNADDWESIIVSLINSVVTAVDPDVRSGDTLDIRPFVKLKCIPGGSISESAFVEGVVFRKNVAHKKMVYNKESPKILILSGGIEFHRQDFRLSSLDTLIDQEDKFLEIMVEKIMSLSPDIILVGKSVSRRAQELLTSHHVVVFQHVKQRLLERIARMTHAMMLPSTDHMIQQYGKECLGSCGSFSLSQPRITSIVTGTTYVYLDGCKSNLGCTLVLRGARKPELKQVKRIIRFCVMVAYHLRLEMAYFADRCAMLPPAPDDEKYVDDSDSEENFNEFTSALAVVGDEKKCDFVSAVLDGDGRKRRYLLAQSLDVDFGLPYTSELRQLGSFTSKKPTSVDVFSRHVSPFEHQTLNISSILMSEGQNQRGRPEIKCIEFYTEQDVPLGQFVIESCFHMVGAGRASGAKINMLDHTLSFVHRPGRIDIATFKAEGLKDYLKHVQLKMASYCKKCEALVTPDINMSEETWKMSFGKFLETNFYNRSAKCRTGGCSHCIRDNHVLFLFCDEGYIVRFEFHPIHPLTLSLRQTMPMPAEYHNNLNIAALDRLGQLKDSLVGDFIMGVSLVEKLSKEYLSSYPNAMEVASADISAVRKLIHSFNSSVSEEIVKLMNEIVNYSPIVTGSTSVDTNVDVSAEGNVKSLVLARGESSSIFGGNNNMQNLSIRCRFPSIIKRDMYLRSLLWRHRLKMIHDYIEVLRTKYAQQSNVPPSPPVSTPSTPASKSMAEAVPDHAHSALPTTAEVDVKDIRDFYMNETPRIPFGQNNNRDENGMLVEAMEGIEDAAMKFVLNPALSTVRASVTTVKNIGHSAATILNGADSNISDVITGDSDALHHSTQSPNIDTEKEKKTTRIGKLRTKLLGKESNSTGTGYNVGDLCEGRLGLPPGRDGVVLEVHEEELATIIAYSLASVEYEEKVNEYLLQADLCPTVSTGDTTPLDTDLKTEAAVNTVEPNTNFPVPKHDLAPPPPAESPGTSNRKASVGSVGSGPLNLHSHSAEQEDDDEDRHEGEVTDIQLANDSLYVMAGERLEAAFKERGDVSTAEAPMIAGSNVADNSEFICHTFWACQFEALRAVFLEDDGDEGYIRSLGASAKWQAQGGKSGASFSKTMDGRFVVKYITRTELQMFLDFAPAYFEYMQKVFYLGLPTILCKVLGVYQIGFHNRTTGKKVMEQVVVMENLFFERNITRIFDLKGSARNRHVDTTDTADNFETKGGSSQRGGPADPRGCYTGIVVALVKRSVLYALISLQVLMDHNLMELTDGKPLPLKFKANLRFHKAILNDTLFLSIINVIDYSILVGIDEDTQELVVGIIDYMRQYDIIKRMERMGKSVGMIAGQAEPTVIQPIQYRKRFVAAMDKYFMAVPDKWSQMK
ncbi:unnamed protein product [Ectocarpus fasciculatus]